MKKAILSIFLLFVIATCSAQMSKHIGHYQGGINTDTLKVTIVMDLYKDSTYTISVQYGFLNNKNCGYGQKKYTGKWSAKKDWIYFKHTSAEEPNFPFTNLWDKPSRHKKDMWKKGYEHELKAVSHKEASYTKIYLHYSEDCFESIWKKQYLAKIE